VPFLAEKIMTQLETARFAPATEKTDQPCPYSKALRGSIDVAVDVL
jgi:organic hydroperoxide reductase OsmC/OhrA